MNKRGFVDVDPEVFMTPAFAILLGMAWVATVMGYIGGKRMGYEALPVWQIVVILLVELVAVYVFVNKE